MAETSPLRATASDHVASGRNDPASGPGASPRQRPRALAILFALLAVPTILIQVYLTPPMQVADEENHFLRAMQVADGHAFGTILADGNAGGVLDPGGSVLAHDFDALKFHPDVKLDIAAYGEAATLRWNSGPATSSAFPNTAIYPFFFYLPASFGIAWGKVSNGSMLDSLYFGRLATGLLSAGLATLALAVCGRGRTLLFIVLCFPMTLSLFASVSQDALSIALGALAAAVWSGYAARDAEMPVRVRVGVALALGMIAAARIPMICLYPLALMPTRSPGEAGRRLRLADGVAAAAGLVPLAIGLYGAHVAKVPFRQDLGVSPPEQLRWLLVHPIEAIEVGGRTLGAFGADYLRELVGVLGWLDLDLPAGFYVWMGLCCAAALALDLFASEKAVPGPWRAISLLAAVAAVAGVFGAFYLAWTPVGAPAIDGVQGRYFIVPLLVTAVSLPGLGGGARFSSRIDQMRFVLCAAVALSDLWIVPISLLHRYYG